MHEPVHEMFTLARHDFVALGAMRDPTTFAEEIFGFHAQQAVEKALKAWLIFAGADYPKTHDLRLLLDLLDRAQQDVSAFRHLMSLTAYGVQFRYSIYEEMNQALDRAGTQSTAARSSITSND